MAVGDNNSEDEKSQARRPAEQRFELSFRFLLHVILRYLSVVMHQLDI